MFKLEYENDNGDEEEPFNDSTYRTQRSFLNKFSAGKPLAKPSSTYTSPNNYGTRSLSFQVNGTRQDGIQGDYGDAPFVCHYCDAKFRIRGYLTRHIKKHAIEKAYRCPFYRADAPADLKCHHSGGFSRRDTYKTHLKTRHLLYPEGVKPNERNKSFGHCAQCGEYCGSVKNWVELHIETGECKGLPQDYLRVVRHERSKNGKLKMIKTSTGHSRYISTVQSIVDPTILSNKDALEAMAIVAHKVNKDNILSKYGQDKIIMDVKDFNSDSEDEQHLSSQQQQQQQQIIPVKMSQPMVSNVFNANGKKPRNNAVDKLLEPFNEVPLDMSVFGFDHFTSATQTPEAIEATTSESTPSPMTRLQKGLLLDNPSTEQNKIEDIYSFLSNDINL